jgi:hypothetical protein
MNMREIIATIDEDGNVKIETKGFKGADCLKATLQLERALGIKTGDVKTREFNDTANTTQSVRNVR